VVTVDFSVSVTSVRLPVLSKLIANGTPSRRLVDERFGAAREAIPLRGRDLYGVVGLGGDQQVAHVPPPTRQRKGSRSAWLST
jgi:hypothetical protein